MLGESLLHRGIELSQCLRMLCIGLLLRFGECLEALAQRLTLGGLGEQLRVASRETLLRLLKCALVLVGALYELLLLTLERAYLFVLLVELLLESEELAR